MKKAAETANTPKYKSESRRCKYCHLAFMTKPTYQGSKQKFCKTAHRKAFFDEGKQPIDVIMKRHEKRVRVIVREEWEKLIEWAPEQMRRIAREEIAAQRASLSPVTTANQSNQTAVASGTAR